MISKMAVLSLKAETAEGVLSQPTATGCFLVEDLDCDLDWDPDEPNYFTSTGRKHEDIPGNGSITITGKIHIKGSGSTGTTTYTEPDWIHVMRACGCFGHQTTGATMGSLTIQESPTPNATGTSYSGLMNVNGKRYLAAGLRGDGTFEGVVGRALKFAFSLQGAVYSVGDATILTPSGMNTTVAPVFFNSIAAFAYDSYNALISRLSLSLGNDVQPNTDPNATYGILSYGITDRNPRGEMDPRECTTGTYNWHAKMLALTQGALRFKIGRAATGTYVDFQAPQVQIPNYKKGDRNGWLVNNAPLKFCGDESNAPWVMYLT